LSADADSASPDQPRFLERMTSPTPPAPTTRPPTAAAATTPAGTAVSTSAEIGTISVLIGSISGCSPGPVALDAPGFSRGEECATGPGEVLDYLGVMGDLRTSRGPAAAWQAR